MFRSSPAVEPVSEVSKLDTADLIPLSHLELDLPRPAEGWADYLGKRAIAFVPDDLGRDCVRRQDARRLLDERRADELRRRAVARQQERQQEEADRQRRAQLPRGVPWHEVPDGVLPATAMLAAAKAEQPRRSPSRTEWLFGEADEMVFQSLQGTDEAS
jgi:hypothetical protein